MLVIGLGSGRSGTASLADLLNSQHGAVCFHELNPACSVFSGNPQSPLNTIREFRRILDGGDKRFLTLDYSRPPSVKRYQAMQAMGQPRIMGDIAYYYLTYVDQILAADPAVKFVCLKRDKTATVESWLKKSEIRRWPSLVVADRLKSIITRTPYHESCNYWQDHDGSEFALDFWDHTFPKFNEAKTKREAISRYWDYYYETAAETEARHPAAFRVFDIAALSNRKGMADILSFVGINDMVLKDEFHLHKINTA